MGSLASLDNLNSLQQDHCFFFFRLFCFVFVSFSFFCGFLLIRHAPVNRQVFGVVVVMTWTENWLKALRWRWVLKDFLCCYQHNSSTGRCFIFERLLSLPYCTLIQTHQLSLQWDRRTLTSSFTSAEILVLVRDRNMDGYVLSTWIRFQSSCVDLLSYLLLTLPIGHQTIQKRCFAIERLHQLQLAFLGVLYGENAFK